MSTLNEVIKMFCTLYNFSFFFFLPFVYIVFIVEWLLYTRRLLIAISDVFKSPKIRFVLLYRFCLECRFRSSSRLRLRQKFHFDLSNSLIFYTSNPFIRQPFLGVEGIESSSSWRIDCHIAKIKSISSVLCNFRVLEKSSLGMKMGRRMADGGMCVTVIDFFFPCYVCKTNSYAYTRGE